MNQDWRPAELRKLFGSNFPGLCFRSRGHMRAQPGRRNNHNYLHSGALSIRAWVGEFNATGHNMTALAAAKLYQLPPKSKSLPRNPEGATVAAPPSVSAAAAKPVLVTTTKGRIFLI